MRAQPLATLVIAHAGTQHVNHIPLYLDPTRGPQGTLIGHVARANALWPLLPQQAVAVFHGPQAYVSPSWYPSKALDGKQVPTWGPLPGGKALSCASATCSTGTCCAASQAPTASICCALCTGTRR